MTIQPPTRKSLTTLSGIVNAIGESIVFRAALVFGFVLMVPILTAAQGPSEDQIKAAFLLNFTKFVGWPPGVFESPNSPLRICILGEDPFGSNMDQLVEGENVSGRKLQVERLSRAPIPKSCHVLFIGKSEKAITPIVAGLGSGILTVSDREGFLQEGGMIAFVSENHRVRFDINQRAAVRASLTMNARLLSVARSVQR